jgi:hypothetical protein
MWPKTSVCSTSSVKQSEQHLRNTLLFPLQQPSALLLLLVVVATVVVVLSL